ncbi:alpha,alpha-trehalase TreF [Hymenobacter caeli]|uniref:Alpha,alpha-trehalase n=1 Tax=Hymenobacter caeli TaxID=2735894 RepID=A0ABX2FPL4_9BACT|nr:alpha,alpha-trehalase TreF [Hymenobacter caeli]NRT18392.1 alpha,alpha-trehalase [Hymenobacter caeli]
MKHLFFAALLLGAGRAAGQPSPRQLYPGLFEAVQLGHVYADGKTFVDATPLQPPAAIEQAYQAEHTRPGFDLKAFADAHFRAPGAAAGGYQSDVPAGIRHHLDTLWTVLARRADDAALPAGSSLVPLPHPYIVPGGRFREVYYWDSYFTMLGLVESHRLALVRHMLDNFAYLIGRYGFVPNGNRTYYLTRSQPPFFGAMVALLAQTEGDTVLLRYQAPLLREYCYWMADAAAVPAGQARGPVVRLPDGTLLNRYWDASTAPREESYAEDVAAQQLSAQPAAQFYRNVRAAAASGWDFSSRWFGPAGTLASIQTTDLVPVDLNCLLYRTEQLLARTYALQGNAARARDFQTAAARRARAVLARCWSPQLGWFVDYNWRTRRPAPQPTLAGVYPLAFGLATAPQAQLVAAKLGKDFLKPGGLATTLATTRQQWDAPNAWAPLQWLAVQGLARYQQPALARTVAQRWTALNVRVFEQTGKLLEKYNVVDTQLKAGGGEYPLQDGFGWTNGVLLNLLNHYPAAAPGQ